MSKFEKSFAGGNPLKADELNQIAAAINDNDEQIASLRDETNTKLTELEGIDESHEETFVNNQPKLYFSGIYIPSGKQFSFRISSETAQWSRLLIYGNGSEYPTDTTWLIDNIINDEEYSFTKESDITNIYVFPVDLTTNGSIKMSLKVDGELLTKYVKPTNGIPKSDLSADIQGVLDKSDSAITLEFINPTNWLNLEDSDWTPNRIINTDNGDISTYEAIDYSVSGYIPCSSSSYYNMNDGIQKYLCRFICFYDENKTYIGSSTALSYSDTWKTPATAKYFRATLENIQLTGTTLQICEGKKIIPYSSYFEPYQKKGLISDRYVGMSSIREDVLSLLRKRIHINKEDSDIELFEKMLKAYSEGNTDVIFENGTYILSDVYIYMRDTLGWTWTMELPIGNGCRYFFNNSVLISNAPLDYSDSRNILGCKAIASDFELYDGVLINNGGTYCVHDECGNGGTNYRHVYKNMRMSYNGTPIDTYGKCIGGGMGVNGIVIIDNCIFNTEYDVQTVTWHVRLGGTPSSPSQDLPSIFTLFFVNSYIDGKIRIDGNSWDTIFVKYSGNANKYDPTISESAESYVFNNTIVS